MTEFLSKKKSSGKRIIRVLPATCIEGDQELSLARYNPTMAQRDSTDILSQLIAREPIFHRPELGTTRADFEAMTVEEFSEIGASGRHYTRAEVLDVLERRHASPPMEDLCASDFQCRHLAPELYLLTYILVQDGTRRTRRSTIWQRTAEGWKIVFHQGTPISEIG